MKNSRDPEAAAKQNPPLLPLLPGGASLLSDDDQLSLAMSSLEGVGGPSIPDLALPPPVLPHQVPNSDEHRTAQERLAATRRQRRTAHNPMSQVGRVTREHSLGKDGRDVMLSSGDGGEGAHEAWLTKRQARRYGW